MCEDGFHRPLVDSYKIKIIMSTVIAITTAIKKYIGFGIVLCPVKCSSSIGLLVRPIFTEARWVLMAPERSPFYSSLLIKFR